MICQRWRPDVMQSAKNMVLQWFASLSGHAARFFLQKKAPIMPRHRKSRSKERQGPETHCLPVFFWHS